MILADDDADQYEAAARQINLGRPAFDADALADTLNGPEYAHLTAKQAARALHRAGLFTNLGYIDLLGAVLRSTGATSIDHVPNRDDASPIGASWHPRDLTAALAGALERPMPTLLRRIDGLGMLYAKVINGIHSDSGTGKGWLALIATKEELDAGRHVWWFDFEDPAEHLLIERLRTLGVPDNVIADQVHYINPDEPATHPVIAELVTLADQHGPSFIVIDSTGECLGLQGLDENKDLDVDQWKRLLPHPFERAGHTVLLIDHGTKAGDSPLYPSGSKRKRALISGAAWSVELVTPFSRDHAGKLKLICAKDRHGTYRRGEIGAWVHIDPTGGAFRYHLEVPTDTDSAPQGGAVILIRRVVQACHDAGDDGLPLRGLRAAARTKGAAANQLVDDAAALAERIGCIEIAAGARGARIHRWLRDPTDDEIRTLIDE
jgi:hypothetical protein